MVWRSLRIRRIGIVFVCTIIIEAVADGTRESNPWKWLGLAEEPRGMAALLVLNRGWFSVKSSTCPSRFVGVRHGRVGVNQLPSQLLLCPWNPVLEWALYCTGSRSAAILGLVDLHGESRIRRTSGCVSCREHRNIGLN